MTNEHLRLTKSLTTGRGRFACGGAVSCDIDAERARTEGTHPAY